MNHFDVLNIPNKKVDAKCCINCGKGYKKKTNLDKHKLLCDVLHKSRNKPSDEDYEINETLPSQKTMYKMLLELGQKYNRMEEKLTEMNKLVTKKKRVNILDWINVNLTPAYIFSSLIDKVVVTNADIEYMFNNSFYDTLNEVFSRTIYNEIGHLPIFVFIKKPNIFYSYENNSWNELTRETLIRFLNQVHLKISKVLFEWKKNHKEQIYSSDTISIMYDKTMVKLMSIDFKQDSTLSRVKNMISNRLKTDVKTRVEYEVE